jgi:Protein of unknown function (DUF1579)
MRLTITAVMLLLSTALHAQRDARQRPPLDVMLDKLVGDWTMTGTALGKPVEYRMDARRTVQGKYVEMHMIDVARPAQYEARVFIGTDTTDRGYIAHWLDNFGASFSIPHGTGGLRGDTLSLMFPYENGNFRDTFVYDPASDSWMFKLETAAGKSWKPFAQYQVRRRPPPTTP